jgi:hypothetical protein
MRESQHAHIGIMHVIFVKLDEELASSGMR